MNRSDDDCLLGRCGFIPNLVDKNMKLPQTSLRKGGRQTNSEKRSSDAFDWTIPFGVQTGYRRRARRRKIQLCYG
jgi:hypothetical protein